MTVLTIKNPFNAPIYHEKNVSSTLDISYQFAKDASPHGTVITADFQSAGRGRSERSWVADRGTSLLFTILLRYPKAIPTALTLRAGLAVCNSIEKLTGRDVKVKWPNDILIDGKKIAGILADAEKHKNGSFMVHLGIGINITQMEFPDHLKATSLQLISNPLVFGQSDFRFSLLEDVLCRLYDELEVDNWKSRLEEKLYKKGEQVVLSSIESEVMGCITGIGDSGELLIIPQGESGVKLFLAGEIRLTSPP